MMGAQRESGEVVNKTAAARLGVRHGEVELGSEDDGDVCEIGLGDVVSASRGEERGEFELSIAHPGDAVPVRSCGLSDGGDGGVETQLGGGA
ncbi:hypothetical protein M0R45_030659 [Rubus argutus]|uniref:Uncharacterized protein n=1 Tax=Rubus argutus TaxID=59490 RepID=A0AAW1WDT8_RUBAR